MRTFTTIFLAALLAGSSMAGAWAAGNRGYAQNPPGNPHGCVNPAGHVRGWCKHQNGNGNYGGTYRGNYVTISGVALAVNGDLVQFRQDNGNTITVNQRNLLQAGRGLQIGGHYTLQGTYSDGLFLAQTGGYYGNANGNGYPYPGSTASVRGIVTAISGNRVTIMQGLFSTINIDDQQALNNGTAQNLYVGRSITAWGYWNGGTFFATSIG